mmetsp:Transcript_21462/g.72751  ORF Transcript_21462/g.72751 Transcript_21462/m.72751 type:complete len:109 (-) Transcript_21462:39-365(-)
MPRLFVIEDCVKLLPRVFRVRPRIGDVAVPGRAERRQVARAAADQRPLTLFGGAAQLAHFPALKLLELASRTWHALFGFYATATLVVVEFYLTDDAPRRREPVIAVDP